EDVGELLLEARLLVFVQPEPGQVSDVLDVLAGDSHGGLLSGGEYSRGFPRPLGAGRLATPRARPTGSPGRETAGRRTARRRGRWPPGDRHRRAGRRRRSRGRPGR